MSPCREASTEESGHNLMGLVGYTYVPSRDDLFLYQDQAVSWTGGSGVFKKPYAWNPSSMLYGYRKSLGGLSAKYRTLSTSWAPAGTEPAWALAANDKTNPANDPAFKNSWPPSYFMLNRKFMLMCRHCFSLLGSPRDPSEYLFGNHYLSGGYIEAVFPDQFIDENDNITVLDKSKILRPYASDPSFPDLSLFGNANDVEMSELVDGYEIVVQPMVIADPRTMVPGSNAWYIDGSHKIIRGRFKASCHGPRLDENFLEATYPDGSPWDVNGLASQQVFAAFLHDSGSYIFVEISPPTSWQAGDGVLGLVPSHEVTGGLFIPSNSRELYAGAFKSWPSDFSGYNIFDPVPNSAISPLYKKSGIAEYCAFRGRTITTRQAARSDIAPTASETAQADMLGVLNLISQFTE